MLPILQSGFDTIEAQKSEILARVSALSEAERNKRPAPDRWSPQEIVHHLVIAEGLVAGQVAALQAAASPPRRARLRPPVVPLITFLMRMGVPLPVPDGMMPEGTTTLDALAAQWAKQRRELGERIAQVDAAALHEPFALHPIAGPLNAREVLALADSHLVYHGRQIKRLTRVP